MKFRIAASAAAEAPPPPGEEEGYAMSGGYIWAPITLALCSMPLVAIGSCLILWGEPVAAGSGIPEVKTYLQGVRLPRMLRVRTLVCKATGVLGSVSGGLVCGKEGPMIHAGAIMAAGLTDALSKLPPLGISTNVRANDLP